MFEQEVDSDDDFEGYFLKPVNEYNIVDKIKEANKELFSTPQPPSPSVTETQRKVKFRPVLEDYEPKTGIIDKSENRDETETGTPTSHLQETSNLNCDDQQNSQQATGKRIFETIPEEISPNKAISNNSLSSSTMQHESESEVEEIIEEVENLNVQNISLMGRCNKNYEHIMQPPPVANQSSNLSASISYEDEDNYSNKTSEEDNDDDDDDDISVIVAAYLPRDDLNDEPSNKPKGKESVTKTEAETKSTSKNSTEDQEDINDKSSSSSKTSGNKKSFYYSLRSRGRSNSGNKVGDLLKLRFNYKTCCEYKNSTVDKLPKYTGYLSTYGLSKEQWEQREKRIEKRKKLFMKKNYEITEKQTKKMEDNEKAFTTWLKNKMRCPINKTRNMFDFKSSRQKKNKASK